MNKLTLEECVRLGFCLTSAFEKQGPPRKPFTDADYYKRPIKAKQSKLYHGATKLHTIGERTRSLKEWSAEYGLTLETVTARMRRGMSLMDALTTPCPMPTAPERKTLTLKGRTMTMQEWADELGLSLSGLSHRLHNPAWTLEKALTRPKRKKAKGEDE